MLIGLPCSEMNYKFTYQIATGLFFCCMQIGFIYNAYDRPQASIDYALSEWHQSDFFFVVVVRMQLELNCKFVGNEKCS